MSRLPKNSLAAVKTAVLAALPDLVRDWLPAGEQRGDIYVARNPLRNDRNLGSFQINTLTGKWRDHAIEEGGNDAVSLYAYLNTEDDYRTAFKALANHPMVRAAILTGATVPRTKGHLEEC